MAFLGPVEYNNGVFLEKHSFPAFVKRCLWLDELSLFSGFTNAILYFCIIGSVIP